MAYHRSSWLGRLVSSSPPDRLKTFQEFRRVASWVWIGPSWVCTIERVVAPATATSTAVMSHADALAGTRWFRVATAWET